MSDKLIKIRGPLRKGQLIASLPTGVLRTREQRFHNFARDEDGKAYGKDFECLVADCEYYRKRIVAGDIALAKGNPPKVKKAAKGGK